MNQNQKTAAALQLAAQKSAEAQLEANRSVKPEHQEAAIQVFEQVFNETYARGTAELSQLLLRPADV